jgi:rare lipoprotein A
MGCAVAGLLALSPTSEARLPKQEPLPPIFQKLPTERVGVASWYGKERQGKETYSGEPFDMNKLTAAHRTLPLGTRVRVTNLANLKTTVVRINDRGPGIEGRIIDVSWAAAKQLGFVGEGLTRVEIEVVKPPKSSQSRSSEPRSMRLN